MSKAMPTAVLHSASFKRPCQRDIPQVRSLLLRATRDTGPNHERNDCFITPSPPPGFQTAGSRRSPLISRAALGGQTKCDHNAS